METYYSFFPLGTATFTFPEDAAGNPSPAYHSLAGQHIIYLDWQLAFPNHSLKCPECGGFLNHTQTNFQRKKGSLFPIWNQDGSAIWCVIMKYTCSKCKENVDANEGRLLQRLPEHMTAAYPVVPQYATRDGGFHLHKDAMQDFEHMLPVLVPSPAPVMHPMTQNVPMGFLTASATRYCCFTTYPFQCESYRNYCNHQKRLAPVLGRPPHDHWCPKKMAGFNCA